MHYVKSSVPCEIILQQLSVTSWHDIWWRRILCFWNAMVEADSASISNIVLRDAIKFAVAQNGCNFGWAQSFRCFAEHGKSSPFMARAPVEVQPDGLLLALQMQQQATFQAVPLEPQSCPGPGMKLCMHSHESLLALLPYRSAQTTGKSPRALHNCRGV